jgi:hypothetical protein
MAKPTRKDSQPSPAPWQRALAVERMRLGIHPPLPPFPDYNPYGPTTVRSHRRKSLRGPVVFDLRGLSHLLRQSQTRRASKAQATLPEADTETGQPAGSYPEELLNK